MPSLSLAISSAAADDHSGIVFEPTSPASSVCPFSPVSISQFSIGDLSFEDESDRSSDSSISPNLTFSFEDWHTPFKLHAPSEIEYDEEGSQIVLIPSSSPFYRSPPTPQFNTSFETQSDSKDFDCSFPSVCPTLSSKFDLLHSHSPLSCTAFSISPTTSGSAQTFPGETVMVVDALDDGFLSGHRIHVVGNDMVDFKAIPDFPEDARLPCIHAL